MPSRSFDFSSSGMPAVQRNKIVSAADAVGLLLATARTQGATLVIATHDARVAALIPPGVEGQIGFQPLNLLRKQL